MIAYPSLFVTMLFVASNRQSPNPTTETCGLRYSKKQRHLTKQCSTVDIPTKKDVCWIDDYSEMSLAGHFIDCVIAVEQ